LPADYRPDSFWEKYRIVIHPYFIVLGVIAGIALYPLKKIWNATRNLLRRTKIARSAYRLSGIGIGGYFGGMQGAVIGAALGSLLPVIGTVAGSLLGMIIGSAVGGTTGALFTKYSAKGMSRLFYGDTNPDKWRLTLEQGTTLANSANPTDKAARLDQVLTVMDAIDAAKKETWVLGSIPGTHSREDKKEWNALLKKVKRGEITERKAENNKEQIDYSSDTTAVFLMSDTYLKRYPSVNLTSNICFLQLCAEEGTGYLFYYFGKDREKIFLSENGKHITVTDLGLELSWIKQLGVNEQNEVEKRARNRILNITSKKGPGHPGSQPLIKMTNVADDAVLIKLYQAGFFTGNRKRATQANSEERNPKLREGLGLRNAREQ